MNKSLYGFDGPLAAPSGSPVRQLAVRRRGSTARRAVELEFYAEAGAPEGALYLDGELVGYLPGVTRL